MVDYDPLPKRYRQRSARSCRFGFVDPAKIPDVKALGLENEFPDAEFLWKREAPETGVDVRETSENMENILAYRCKSGIPAFSFTSLDSRYSLSI